ncbi:PAN/Apple domain-containing protein [Bradyrhizobium canariense]|nr:PAN/Apple domain-containing protein [Bradyrhizobium canariense]
MSRTYTVWDSAPARDLDFTWQPITPSKTNSGRISGVGRLVWRAQSKPVYDRASVIAEYRGMMVGGRMEGSGLYVNSAGFKYEGQWHHGLMEGRGLLQFPSGDEFVGEFRRGRANGSGRLIDTTGEVYEGAFRDGLRHGHGRTILLNGSAYASSWVTGKETTRSHLVRMAQLGGVNLFSAWDDVRIGLGIDRKFPDRVQASDAAIWYEISNGPDAFEVRPAGKRLMSLWRGKGELQLSFEEEANESGGAGVLGQYRKQFVPLNLRIEIQNRASAPIQVTGVYLDVKRSSTENKPAIEITIDTYDSCLREAGYSSSFQLQNYGWAQAKDVVLRLGPAQPGGSSLNIVKKLGDLDRTLSADVEGDLKALGVDMEYFKSLEEGFSCSSQSTKECLKELRATKKFGQLTDKLEMQDTTFLLRFAAQLDYRWQDANGQFQSWTHPFKATLPLGFLKRANECGEGGGPQVITTKTQKLKVDATGYQVAIPYQTTIAPSHITPLIVSLEAPKSSVHEFSAVVQLADGRQIRSRPINLLYYRPRWFAENDREQPQDAYLQMFDLDGTELQRINSTDETDCSDRCDADTNCVGFSMNIASGLCSLKGGITSMRRDPRVISGLKKGTKRPGISTATPVIEHYTNSRFRSDPYAANLKSSPQECEKQCKADPDCAAFNFATATNICYLIDERLDHPEKSVGTNSGLKFQP